MGERLVPAANPPSGPEAAREPVKRQRIRFSVLIPVWHPDPDHLERCIRSVVEQTYDGWELILVVNGPQPAAVESVLRHNADGSDGPVQLIRLPENRGISVASQAGLDLATGDFVALLDHDDVLSVHALGAFAAELERFDDVDLAYSDEDKLAHDTDERKMPFYKPSFSMERLRCQMYLGHLLVLRRTVVDEVGGFRPEFDGAQDHDLALRVAERSRRVVHVPRLLYHWRESPGSTAMTTDAKDWAWDAGRRAVDEHLHRTGFPGSATPHPKAPGVTVIEPRLRQHPLVSIIVPTGGSRRSIHGIDTLLVETAVTSIVERSSYPNYELVIVTDSKADVSLSARIAAGVERAAPAGEPMAARRPGGRSSRPPLRFVADDQAFNFARACNLGAVRAAGDVLLFLNDDTEITMPNWLERLVMYATRPDIGAVGAKLLYGDGRVQHAGVWARGAGPAHRYMGFSGDHPGNFHALRLAQNCLAVTAACLAVERSKFESVGGFSTAFPLSYNDVDFCLKLHQAGFRNVVDCQTEVVHHESSSRDPTVRDWEMAQLFRRWRPLLMADPYDHPCNLAAGVEEYPPAPIDIVERKAYERHELVLTGRSRVVGRSGNVSTQSTPVAGVPS
ncbi:MAG: glycosyltransferase [Acidimicrobiia bacterium]|nr:glycosyltransferase [Acidimicrobiia bacterium]